MEDLETSHAGRRATLNEEAAQNEAALLRMHVESADIQAPERGRFLSIMARANQIAAYSGSDRLAEGMIDLMIESTQAECANLFLLDANSDELVLRLVRGDEQSQYMLGLRLNRQQGLPGITIQGSQPVVIGDLFADPHWLRSVDPASAARKRNVINLPLVARGATLGVIQIFNYQQVDLDVLQILGERLSNELIQRMELENTRRSKQRLSQLIDVLGQVAGTLDRNRLLRLVTENVAHLVHAERSSIFLVDPATDEMIFQVAYRAPKPDELTADKQSISSMLGAVEPGSRAGEHPDQDFSYFNRSAITVPLQHLLLASDSGMRSEKAIGGLMALNPHSSAFLPEDAQLMHILANQTSTFLQVADMYESAGELFLDAIRALAAAIDAKDPYTQGHSQRVSDYAVLIAREMALDEEQVNDIRIASLLHDVGKIGIPDAILLKKGSLTPEEYEIIKRHSSTGVNILSQVRLLAPVLPGIAQHHERLDGSGYPGKRIGGQISMMGRIVAVADVFDAMTSDRPYRPAMTAAAVLAYLEENSGALFDGSCVQALKNVLQQANPGAIE
jgi:HD-GYP domain-containing protein (c-di-GMP phosphodiesterase class II)